MYRYRVVSDPNDPDGRFFETFQEAKDAAGPFDFIFELTYELTDQEMVVAPEDNNGA